MNVKFVGQLSVQTLFTIKIQLMVLEMKCMDRQHDHLLYVFILYSAQPTGWMSEELQFNVLQLIDFCIIQHIQIKDYAHPVSCTGTLG